MLLLHRQSDFPVKSEYNVNLSFSFGENPAPNAYRPPLETIPSVRTIQNPFAPVANVDFRSKSPEAESKFQNTIPVLVAFPLLVITSNFAVSSSLENDWISRMLMPAFQACVVLGVAKFTVKVDSTTVLSNSVTYLVSIGGLVLFFLGVLVLPASRAAVVYFCLYLNLYNPFTAVAFLFDMFFAYQDSFGQSLATLFGYLALVGSFLVLKQSFQTKNALRANPAFIYGTIAISGVLLVVFRYELLRLPVLAMNLATAVLLLFSLPEAHLKLTTNVLVVLVLTYGLETLVFHTLNVNFANFAVSVLLPLLVKIDYSQDFKILPNEQKLEAPKIFSEVMKHSDTRAIFNFLLLNTAFMFVQLLYSFRSKSLGLLSDSLHMALDCASLALGLVAGVLLKHPINANGKYPFGLRNFEILAGFANGTLLVGISGSIIFEAIGRLFHPVSLQQTTELIVVSILGLLVNVVGISAFNHGHSHGHSHTSVNENQEESHQHHGHADSHKQEHTDGQTRSSHSGHSGHSHSHADSHSGSNSHSDSHSDSYSNSHLSSSSSHSNSLECLEMNDNMRGIFLHILADTLGSVGVVISTILTKIFHWEGFDPVALIIIAVLIFMTAIPLMKSTAATLLLKLNTTKELMIRAALNDITTIKGIKSFTTPRFWPTDNSLRGYIHIQIYRGENGVYIRRQCQEVFSRHSIDATIQMENDYDSCWCR